jgi:hypothetical protein
MVRVYKLRDIVLDYVETDDVEIMTRDNKKGKQFGLEFTVKQ